MCGAALFGLILGALLVLAGCDPSERVPSEESLADRLEATPWVIGGVGGAFLLAEPGELLVEVFKRDLHAHSGQTDLRATLLSPDRAVLDEVTLPFLGGSRGDPPAPVQSAVLRAEVERRGIYVLAITVRQDPHGRSIAWGLRTNAAHYLIQTSRGEMGGVHEEPIVLLDPERPANVCFLPRTSDFAIEVRDLLEDVGRLTVYDENGEEKAVLEVVDGVATAAFPADSQRGATPWCLHLPKGKATVHIDGVTRWEEGDLQKDMALWTPDPQSWFPLPEYRWLITPYQRTVWTDPGAQGRVTFRVHNNAAERRTVRLELEFSGDPWPAGLSEQLLVLEPGQSKDVDVAYTAPYEGAEHIVHVRATPEEDPEISTFVTLTVRVGKAPADHPLELPLVLKPWAHENRQFGYFPEWPVDNQVYFDLQNRPYVVTSRGLRWRGGDRWVESRLSEAVTQRVPEFAGDDWKFVSSKIAFDADNHVYLLASCEDTVTLLHSDDGGRTFTAYAIPGREDEPRTWDFESFSGHNVSDGPPPILRYTRTHVDTEGDLKWRRLNDLDLFLPEKTEDGMIVIGDPVRITDKCIGISMHSGIPSSVVTWGSKVHVIWGEATEPQDEVPGVPIYVATYNRMTGTLGEPILLGFGPPPNDIHNTPSITVDSQGYLHAVLGAHGRPFQYTKSLEPNDVYAGWTEPAAMSERDLRQTYVGLVCGADDSLHLVFRLSLWDQEPFPGDWQNVLAYQRKRPGQGWEEPQVLVVPPFSDYSIYYHRLTVDRLGGLYLSYNYWSTSWFYRNDHRCDPVDAVSAGSGRPGTRHTPHIYGGWGRTLLFSSDGGKKWELR